ncbi:unnamed protein product [Linum tenue]|uniref:Glycosyltransferase n=1 Tax=Linum tenue TaxID=586396 RepID=A0AAV0JWX8_9ROSI|nr:unnamed protein product [Linum tenue]
MTTTPAAIGEIWVISFHGQGHLLPTFELCQQFLSRKLRTTLFVSSRVSSSVPPPLSADQLFHVVETPQLPPPPPPSPDTGDHFHHRIQLERVQMAECLQKLLAIRGAKPLCAVVDHLRSWIGSILHELDIPAIGFFTSGACSAAMEHAMWKAGSADLGEIGNESRLLPGLPDHMAVTGSDLKRRPFGHSGRRHPSPPPPESELPKPHMGRRRKGPPAPGDQPHWFQEMDGFAQYLYNTCHELEAPFIEYLNEAFGKPVRAVGPLLPDKYWKSTRMGSTFRDQEVRVKRETNVKEEEVIEWLDCKPAGSVLYVSFGSEVGPTIEEYSELAEALEASNRPFIWTIQLGSGPFGSKFNSDENPEQGFYPHGLQERVGKKRGLIIHGWAPQLLILSHPSTAAFLSHCGWNSTVEAIGCGIPILAWPIRGDQYHNAKLVVKHWAAGEFVTDDFSKSVNKNDIARGIEDIMGQEEVKKNARAISVKLENGFPVTSTDALNAFRDSILRAANS